MTRLATPAKAPVALDLVALAVVWCAMAAMVHPLGDFPLNDDWVYAQSVHSILNGRFEVSSFSSANLGLMAYWGAAVTWVFGFSFTALRFSTLLLGLLGVIAIYLLARRIWSQRIVGLIVALMVAVNPVYFALSCSFMTDVPFFALLAAGMLAVVVGLQRGDDGWTYAGLGLGLAAMSIRQFAIVLFVGFALARIARSGFRWRSIVAGLTPLVVALVFNALFTVWLVDSGRKGHAGGIASQPFFQTFNPGVFKWSALTTITTLGLFLLPVTLACVPPLRSSSRSSRLASAAVVVVALGLGALVAQRHLTVPLGENILQWYGIGPLTNADTLTDHANLPTKGAVTSMAWLTLTVATVIGAACMLVVSMAAVWAQRHAVRRALREGAGGVEAEPSWFVLGVGASYLGILMVLAATGFAVFDRYLLPLLPIAALQMPRLVASTSTASSVRRGPVVAAFAMLVLSAVFTVVGTHDYLSWSRVRWSALEVLRASGVSPLRIDGGYEFNGSLLYDRQYRPSPSKSWWWVHDDEYMTASGPRPGYTVMNVYPVDRWWKAGGNDVVILHRDSGR